MWRMAITVRVKELAPRLEMDYVGVAAAERLRNAPLGWRTDDILPGARSVVVMGIRIPPGARLAQKRARQGLTLTAKYGTFIYQVFGYNILNDKLNLAAYAVAKLLEDAGHSSVPIPTSPPYDPKELVGIFSHRHAALAAGLGELGWNNLLLTPEDGPKTRLVSVISTAELEPDEMYHGPPLCDPAACGKVCAQVCPTKALSPDIGEQGTVGDRGFEYGLVKSHQCLAGQCGLCLLDCPVGP